MILFTKLQKKKKQNEWVRIETWDHKQRSFLYVEFGRGFVVSPAGAAKSTEFLFYFQTLTLIYLFYYFVFISRKKKEIDKTRQKYGPKCKATQFLRFSLISISAKIRSSQLPTVSKLTWLAVRFTPEQ